MAQCAHSATAQALPELWLLWLQMTQAILSTYNKIIVIDNIVYDILQRYDTFLSHCLIGREH